METITFIFEFMVANFLKIWPYLLITIPIAVAVNLSGASKYINRAFQASPLVAIVLATAVGAFSPFCSCTVIPIVASLLISGVPLAPVMAFWIASPSMDPEIFFLSVGMLGWELAVWRLASTLLLSLGAGFFTHLTTQKGWLGNDILKERGSAQVRSTRQLLGQGWQAVKTKAVLAFSTEPDPEPTTTGSAMAISIPLTAVSMTPAMTQTEASDCSSGSCAVSVNTAVTPETSCCSSTSTTSCDDEEGATCAAQPTQFRTRLIKETWSATRMVIQFMALAFFLEAIILLFVPQELIISLLGEQNQFAVPLAALLGVPVYTSNLAALPLIGGLLTQGMSAGAALAFLIAGPTTTLPAMAAVWTLVKVRIFAFYVAISLVGAMLFGTIYTLLSPIIN